MMAGFSPYFAVFLNDNRVTWREFCQSGIEVLHPPVAVVLSQLHTVSQEETSYLQKYQTVDLLQTWSHVAPTNVFEQYLGAVTRYILGSVPDPLHFDTDPGILGYVHWITDPDPTLFGQWFSRCQ